MARCGRWLQCSMGALADKAEEQLRSVVLPPGAWAVGRRLEEARARGAAVAFTAVRRHGITGREPADETELREGDVVVIYGTPAALEHAEAVLLAASCWQGRMPPPHEPRRSALSATPCAAARGPRRARAADGRGAARAGRRGVLPAVRAGPAGGARWREGDARRARGAGAAACAAARRRSRASCCGRSASWFQLANLAEKVHRIRRRREYFQQDSERPQPGGVDDALAELKAAGLSLEQVLEAARPAVHRAGDAGAPDGVHPPHDAAAPAALAALLLERDNVRSPPTSAARCSSACAPRSAPTGRPRSIRASA